MLELAADAMMIVDTSSPHGPMARLEPISSLLPLHLVDRNFHAVLEGSPKLQRAMFCQTDYLTNDMLSDRVRARGGMSDEQIEAALHALPSLPLTPLSWLLQENLVANPSAIHAMLGGADTVTLTTVVAFDSTRTKMSTSRTKFKKMMASPFGAAQASWRRIKIFQSDVEFERLQWACVNYFPPIRGVRRANHYFEKFVLEDGMTLGEVFEKMVGIMTRKQAQHVAAAIAAENYKE